MGVYVYVFFGFVAAYLLTSNSFAHTGSLRPRFARTGRGTSLACDGCPSSRTTIMARKGQGVPQSDLGVAQEHVPTSDLDIPRDMWNQRLKPA